MNLLKDDSSSECNLMMKNSTMENDDHPDQDQSISSSPSSKKCLYQVDSSQIPIERTICDTADREPEDKGLDIIGQIVRRIMQESNAKDAEHGNAKKPKKSSSRKSKNGPRNCVDSSKKFRCEFCSKTFCSLYNVRRHYRNVHKIDMPTEVVNNTKMADVQPLPYDLSAPVNLDKGCSLPSPTDQDLSCKYLSQQHNIAMLPDDTAALEQQAADSTMETGVLTSSDTSQGENSLLPGIQMILFVGKPLQKRGRGISGISLETKTQSFPPGSLAAADTLGETSSQTHRIGTQTEDTSQMTFPRQACHGSGGLLEQLLLQNASLAGHQIVVYDCGSVVPSSVPLQPVVQQLSDTIQLSSDNSASRTQKGSVLQRELAETVVLNSDDQSNDLTLPGGSSLVKLLKSTPRMASYGDLENIDRSEQDSPDTTFNELPWTGGTQSELGSGFPKKPLQNIEQMHLLDKMKCSGVTGEVDRDLANYTNGRTMHSHLVKLVTVPVDLEVMKSTEHGAIDSDLLQDDESMDSVVFRDCTELIG